MSPSGRLRPTRPTVARVALGFGVLLLTAFVYVVLAHGANGGNVVAIMIAVVLLIAAGNLLYGRHSTGAKALARTRDAQEAHDRAADLAADARRATAAADRRGERYCPMDPAVHDAPAVHDDAHDRARTPPSR
jgi:putative intracellular protease/amidase